MVSDAAPLGLRFIKPITVDKEYQKIEWRFTIFTRIRAMPDRMTADTNAK